jgi:arylformamidase
MTFPDLSRLRILDLSQNFSTDSPAFARYEGPTVKWVKRISFEGVNAQYLGSTIHLSTHLDAPLHFYDPGPDVAGIGIEKLFGPAVVVDLEQFGIGDYDIYGPEHFEAWEQKYGIPIQPGDILVIHTGWHRYYNDVWYPATCGEAKPNLPKYFLKQPGPRRPFADWVLKRGIRWMAIDAMSPDHPMDTVVKDVRPDVAQDVARHHGRSIEELWPREDYQLTHTLLFPHGVFHIENLGGQIDEVLNQRVWLGAFPFRFKGGEAAWCRVVAWVEP